MKIYLKKAIFINRAPFDKLELDFDENEVAVLSAVNGKGKTTILSHIVDAFYEMARTYFQNEFEGKENKFYRISSAIYNIDLSKPSFVYLRFSTPEGNVDYLDIREICTENEYNSAILLEDKIPFNQFQSTLNEVKNVKTFSSSLNQEKVEKFFFNNLLTYFPSYRYENPGYLNDTYKIKLDFKKLSGFSGFLKNPIEVVSDLGQLTNWMLDVVLDKSLYNNIDTNQLLDNLNLILTQTLISKKYGNLRFGIGPRNLGGTRIQILKNIANGERIYPSVFNLSSGESSILCLFGELLRQADNLNNNVSLQEITGIVLIDEIDKHLHIKLQKEILPKLIKLFPNIQFIVSSHSPFLSMGLAEEVLDRSKIIDLDNLGISKDPTKNELYLEVYNMMVNENDRFKDLYLALEHKINSGSSPLIITEGKTDIYHIKKAKEKLNIENCDVEFYEINEEWGDSKLNSLLTHLSKVFQSRKIIGVFDRDNITFINEIEKDNQLFKDYGNNVYSFCIPLVNNEIYGEKISIEHYYPESILKKENSEGRRLFLGSEFYKSGNSKDDNYQTRISNIQNKVDINGVIDEKVYKSDDLEHNNCIALTKSDFALLITNNNDFIGNFDFIIFSEIFNKIKAIIGPRLQLPSGTENEIVES